MKTARIFLLLVIFRLIATAQNSGTGIPPFGSFTGGTRYDIVNNQNLNAHLMVPFTALAGRGMNFNFAQINDSKIWTPTTSGGTKSWAPIVDSAGNPTWGWQTATPTGSTSVIFDTIGTCSTIIPPGIHVNVPLYHVHNWIYTDIQGTQHAFPSVDLTDICQNNQVVRQPTGPGYSFTGYASDASGFFINANTLSTSPTGVMPTGLATGLDGVRYYGFAGGGFVEDRNGNFLSNAVQGSTVLTWTNTTGQLALTVTKSANAIQYTDANGNSVATVNLQTLNIQTSFGCSGVIEYSGAATVPSSISLPNGQSFSFTYETTPGNSSTFTGRLKTVTLPYGGSYEYDYPGANDGINCADGSTLQLTRKVSDGTNTRSWTFVRSGSTTTLTAPQLSYDPAGNDIVYAFDGNGHETSRKIYQGSSSGTQPTLLRTVNTTWATNGTPATSVEILEDGITQAETDTSYDSNGILQSTSFYDFGNGSHGPLLKSISFSYLAASNSNYAAPRNLINLISEIQIKDANGTVQNRMRSNFDESGTMTSCPTGVPQHDDSSYGCSFLYRGNLTSVLTYKDPVTPANPVTRSSTNDFFGNILTASLNAVRQSSATFSHTTNYSYPDSVTYGPSGGPQFTNSYTYNNVLGQLASIQDANGQITQYGYDTLGRISTITRPDLAQISYGYNDSAHTITRTSPVDGSHSIQRTTALDPLDRVLTTSVADGTGNVFSIIQNQYDEVSRLSGTSNPYTGASPSFFSTIQFDALGRTRKLILPDGQQSVYSYSLQKEIFTDPTGKQIQNKADALGRLTEVDLPNLAAGTGGTNATASVTISGSLQASPNGGGNPPLAAANTPLTSFVASDGSSHAFYLDTHQHIWHLFWNSTAGWQNQDLTALTGNTVAAANSSLSAVFDSSSNTHVFYLDSNQHVHELFCCYWQDHDLTAITGNTLAASGTALTSEVSSGNPVHLYYLGTNQHIYHMFISVTTGAWQNQDLTALSGGPAAAAGTALSNVLDSSNFTRVFYLDGNQHVNELYCGPGQCWLNQDLTAITGNTLAGAGTGLTGYAFSSGNPVHLHYVGANQHVYHLYISVTTGAWLNQDLTAITGASAAATSAMTSVPNNSNGSVRLYFLDGNQHINETYCGPGQCWTNTDMTSYLGATPASGSKLTSFGMPSGNIVHVHYEGANQHIWHMYLSSASGWSNQDTFSIATVTLPDSGTVGLTVGDFTATACFGPSSNSACAGQDNTTASAIASALAQALNASSSPVTATASGATLNLTWKNVGPNTTPINPLATIHDNPGSFPNPSFTSPATQFTNGAYPGITSTATTTTYTLNVLDQITGVNQAGQTRSAVYDNLGRMTSYTTPETGTVTFQYNDFNLVTQSTDARNVVTNFTFDGLNRLTGQSYTVPGGSGITAMPNVCDPNNGAPPTANVCLYYDQGGSTAFALNQLTTIVDSSGSEAFAYDKLGRMTQRQKSVTGTNGGNAYVTQYQYNLGNELTQITYPSGRQVKPAYDGLGRLASIADATTTYASNFAYNTAQQMTGFTYGNGITASYGYSTDGRLQLSTLKHASTSQTFVSLSYGYSGQGGNNGQITSIIDNVDNGRSISYLYDALGRLQEAYTAGSASYPNWDLAFSYDAYGNRTDETPQPDTSPNITAPSNHVTINTAKNQIATAGYGYDAAGNMTNDGVNTLAYDGGSHVVSSSFASTTTSYIYDGAGVRVRKCQPNCSTPNSSTVYIFSGNQPIAEYDNGAAAGSPSREYIYAPAGLLATIDSAGTKYHLRDHLSPRVTTNSAGTKLGEQGLFPFGEFWYSANTTSKLRFTTYENDPESGNDYAMARYYISRLCRFNSPDAFGGSVTNPRSLNRYSYVMNDPINHVDPLGLAPMCNMTVLARGGNLSDLQRRQLQAEMNRIFSTGGADVHIDIVTSGPANYTLDINPTPAHGGPNDFGITLSPVPTSSSELYTNRIDAVGPTTDIHHSGWPYQGPTPAGDGSGIIYGRIASHEMAGHGMLGYSHTDPGDSTRGFLGSGPQSSDALFKVAGNPDPNKVFSFSSAQGLALHVLCILRTQKFDTLPGGGSGGFIIDLRPILPLPPEPEECGDDCGGDNQTPTDENGRPQLVCGDPNGCGPDVQPPLL